MGGPFEADLARNAISTVATCGKGIINGYKDANGGRGKVDMSCVNRGDCSTEDLDRIGQDALSYAEQIQGGACVSDSSCSPISNCSGICICKIKPWIIVAVSILAALMLVCCCCCKF